MALSAEEQEQYNRHLILDEVGLSGQEKLKTASVLVIGAGGLGCPILSYLSAAGVGRIGIVDHDAVDQSNLQRQVLYAQSDISTPKVEAAKKKLSRLNPFVKFEVYNEKLTCLNAVSIFSKYDIVVDGSDNFPTRYLVNDAAILIGKPVVFGSVFKFEGQVSVFNYKGGPSYRCLYPSPPSEHEAPNCSEIGVLGVLPGIIGSLQANEVIKIICGIGEVLSGKLLIFDALSLNQSVLRFTKNKDMKIERLEDSYERFCGVPQLTEITLTALKASGSNYHLLDVRTDLERESEHIGGMHIPLHELASRSHEVLSDEPIVVYCKAGVRSAQAIQFLKASGFKNQLINLKGGLFYSK
ncbi:MAG: molybdopterin-synthase adenylyltransferase MoeB [Crocinitomicaceae bacterium]|nr:molybdopterin-synthase adenylyltransferase MoeB [Crocinitomicaceae bacterium]MDG1777200.1 molybdopterin-synthase adenylyltransferase MoeB [Crocinitomicaceae bacterium]